MYLGSVMLISMCVLRAFSTSSLKQFRYISVLNIRVSNVNARFTDVMDIYGCARHCKNNDNLMSGTCVSFGYNEVLNSCEVNIKPLDLKKVKILMNEVGWKLWESHPCSLAFQQSRKCLYMTWTTNTALRSWYDGNAFCRNMGSHMSLMKVESEAENVALNSVLNVVYNGRDYDGIVHIGANKVNTTWYVWTDGTPVTYDNFPADFTPQAAGDGCVIVYITDAEGVWGEKPCSQQAAFVCQRLLD